MQTQTPCSDHVETKGLIYFARMLDKIRLKARGELPPDYFTGVDEDPTMFDARCTRFLGVNYDELVERTLKADRTMKSSNGVSSAASGLTKRKSRSGMRF